MSDSYPPTTLEFEELRKPASGDEPITEVRTKAPGAGSKKTVALRERTTKADRDELFRQGRELYPEDNRLLHPKTRADCAGGARPCPHVSCRFNLAVEVTRAGAIVVVHPDVEVADLEHTCALDEADSGPHTYEYVAKVLNVTKERVRQIEEGALRTLAASMIMKAQR